MAKVKRKSVVVLSPEVSDRISRYSGSDILTVTSKKKRSRIRFPEGQGRTRQSFKNECDINNIVGRFKRTGVWDSLAKTRPSYGDVTGVEFQGAMDLVVEAREMFGDLPSSVRTRFDNDPAQFLEFAQLPENQAEMAKMGLADPEATPPAASPLPVAPEPSTPSQGDLVPPAKQV